MEYVIKQLSQNSQIFFPQTSAEAVLVNDSTDGVITLDKVLNKKIENIVTPAGSGLIAYKQDKSVILTHSNSIETNELLSPNLIKYDNRGHIIETAPFGSIQVKVDQEKYVEYNGQSNKEILMGDDFGIDQDKNIILKWNNI